MSTMKILIFSAAMTLLVLTSTAAAHFGTVIPSKNIVTPEDSRSIALEVKFIHPMEGQYMEMEKPKKFGVLHNNTKTDLLPHLVAAKGNSPSQSEKFTYWKTDYQIKRPGDYTFYVEPKPYWEPAEDLFIVHYTKVCVNAFGLEEGWDEKIGLETEIIPKTRPYGLWTGNLFTGQVLVDGQPAAHAEVEVEYLNESPGNRSALQPPSNPFVTQVVIADADGVFSYAMPKAGWWGFSALNEAGWKLKKDGVEKGVEIGAVYWVHTVDIP